jgi:hypothetical protein
MRRIACIVPIIAVLVVLNGVPLHSQGTAGASAANDKALLAAGYVKHRHNSNGGFLAAA